jgi:hypothetical protein
MKTKKEIVFVPAKSKKHLSFTALRKFLSSEIRTWKDARRENGSTYSIHDAVMSGFACMYFQEPSLLQFQEQMEHGVHQNNLKTLFGVRDIPKSNTLKEIVDEQDSKVFNPLFKGVVQRLQRGKQLSQFKLHDGLMICAIDATQYHGSESIRCKKCLTKHKNNEDKPTMYQHFALQAALMHPDQKQVLPIMAESIENSDGTKKQDCEINAAKRMIPQLKQEFPKMGLIITGDDLFSRQPMIETVLSNNLHYIFVAKPASHAYMMEWLAAYDKLDEYRMTDERGQTILYQWKNGVPINGDKSAARVNYFCKKTLAVDVKGNEKVRRTESWVTDLEITHSTVGIFVCGGKCRWKIENECFNTTKNHGYNLEHNYGHGEKNLAFNFYLLTMLAFLFHQVSELCDATFKAARKKGNSKRNFWEKLRSFVSMFVFETWEQLLDFFLNSTTYNIIDGHAVKRFPP